MHSPTPWSIDRSQFQSRIVDAKGCPVVDPIANEDGMSDEDRERIVACVNACQDYETGFLQRRSRSLIPILLDCPDGDTLAQARCWESIWKSLWDAGMHSYVGNLTGSGIDRAVEFVEELGRRSKERQEWLLVIAAIITQLGGEFHLLQKSLAVIRPDGFQIECRKDEFNRSTIIRVVTKGKSP
jgi:hypothetical protein